SLCSAQMRAHAWAIAEVAPKITIFFTRASRSRGWRNPYPCGGKHASGSAGALPPTGTVPGGEERLRRLRPSVFGGPHAPPETRGELGVHVGEEGGELGEGALEELGGHPSVLGGVEGASGLGDQGVEPIEEGEGRLAEVGEVEREGDARAGEGEHPRGALRAEGLQHHEEGALPRAGDDLQEPDDGVGVRDDALPLEEAARAVDAGPIPDAVQGIEEGLVGHRRPSDGPELLAVVGEVEEADARLAEDEVRRVEGDAQPGPPKDDALARGAPLSVVAAVVDPPSEPSAPGEDV